MWRRGIFRWGPVIISVVLRVVVVAAAVWTAGFIAHATQFNVHPDEFVHVDAAEYFRTHWFRPTPGSPLVYYSLFGWSRVYTGEIAYFLFGKIGWAALKIWPHAEPFQVYRYCNVGLFLVTLTILMSSRCRLFAPWLLAVFVSCIPQVIYIYSYANSDAFGLSVSLLLLLQAGRLLDRLPSRWGVGDISWLMILLLCTLLAKTPFVLGVLLPSALLIIHLVRHRPAGKFVATRLIIPLAVVYIFVAWWNPLLSPWHAQWRATMTAMRMEKASAGRKPHDPAPAQGANLIDQHWTYSILTNNADYDWFRSSGRSFYGQFGYMTVVISDWMYAWAGYLPLGLLFLTSVCLLIYRNLISWNLFVCIASAPLIMAANIFGSMYNSLHFDYQPQGRYLFAAIPALFFLCYGTWVVERWWWRAIRLVTVMTAAAFSIYVAIEYVALNPNLR